MDSLLNYKNKFFVKKGFSVVEAMISCAIFGIAFVAFLSLSTYGIDLTQKLMERTKASLLTNMILEDMIIDQANISDYDSFTFKNNNLSEVSATSGKQKTKWVKNLNRNASPSSADIRKVTVSLTDDDTGKKKNRVVIEIESFNKKVKVLSGRVFNSVE